MAYLLNVLYLAAIVLASPWLLFQRLRHGKYREVFTAKFWGELPRLAANRLDRRAERGICRSLSIAGRANADLARHGIDQVRRRGDQSQYVRNRTAAKARRNFAHRHRLSRRQHARPGRIARARSL